MKKEVGRWNTTEKEQEMQEGRCTTAKESQARETRLQEDGGAYEPERTRAAAKKKGARGTRLEGGRPRKGAGQSDGNSRSGGKLKGTGHARPGSSTSARKHLSGKSAERRGKSDRGATGVSGASRGERARLGACDQPGRWHERWASDRGPKTGTWALRGNPLPQGRGDEPPHRRGKEGDLGGDKPVKPN